MRLFVSKAMVTTGPESCWLAMELMTAMGTSTSANALWESGRGYRASMPAVLLHLFKGIQAFAFHAARCAACPTQNLFTFARFRSKCLIIKCLVRNVFQRTTTCFRNSASKPSPVTHFLGACIWLQIACVNVEESAGAGGRGLTMHWDHATTC